MQQRQPRLGDILDDYCPRERRLTNHAVVAMVGDAVKQTRCTTCDAEHAYKHAKIPKQRKKGDDSLYSQVLAGVTPKKLAVASAPPAQEESLADDLGDEPLAEDEAEATEGVAAELEVSEALEADSLFELPGDDDSLKDDDDQVAAPEEGPVHRQLIRATLPRHEGQVATTRQAPDFTIRQPATARPNRFRPRQPQQQQRGAQFQGNRTGGGNAPGGNRPGGQRQAGRQQPSRPANRHGSGRNRPK